MTAFTIAGERIELERESVEARLERVLPEPIHEHYVVVQGRRFPPKQVIGELTGLDRADFTTHQARRILKRLGFVAARRGPKAPPPPPDDELRGLPHGGRQAEALRPYIGQWVALAEDDPCEVLVGADSYQAVLSWLARHDQRSGGIFRVPRSDAEIDFSGPS